MRQQFGGITDITLISSDLPTHFYEQTWSHSVLAEKVPSPTGGLAEPWLCAGSAFAQDCTFITVQLIARLKQAGRAEERAGEERRKMGQS